MSWVSWWKLKALVAMKLEAWIVANGIRAMGFWSQLGIVVGVLLVVGTVVAGPTLLATFRKLRTGENPRPGLLVLILVTVPFAVLLMPILGRWLQHVLEHNPGPIV